MFIIKVDCNYWNYLMWNLKKAEVWRGNSLRGSSLLKLIVIFGNCSKWCLEKNRHYKEIVASLFIGFCCVLCSWNLLRRNIHVTNRRRIKLVCKNLRETETTKKWKWGRKTRKERKKELTENVFWLATVLWTSVAWNVPTLIAHECIQ